MKLYREKTPEALEISITGSKPPSSEMNIEMNSAQRKLLKTKMTKTMIIPKASNVDLSKAGSLRGKDDEVRGNWKDKVKTVELQIVKAATGSRAKGTAKKVSRPKNKPTPPPPTSKASAKKTSPAHNACHPHIVCGSNMTKMIFADKQFLHITTPKPIGVNPASQRGSSSKLFDTPSDTVYPWADALSIIPRGRLIEESQILSPYTQRFPDKRFQACITPSSYPSSSIDVQIQGSSIDDSPSLEHCRSEEDIHKISSSKKSVQKVGPFLKL
ncbi:uncharacterized protein LOC114575378 [Exaiptasia diaphana]|uniref:Uncharacterized protein n=1 Tax=Exaiptasia diaphana TaxID=2652724 RepID=A0A913YN55_EXADI|nr:uncharacterized protein LOC114575378 [Exaiptasia diaphana]